MEQVVLFPGARTAIGNFGGSLKDFEAGDLGALVTKEAISRAGITPQDVEEVVFGCVGQIGENAYLGRVAAIKAGVPIEATAMTVNRLCSSGMQAIVSAAQSIQTGDVKVAVAGGAESMSTLPFLDYARRWGHKFGPVSMQDALNIILSDPFDKCAMGMTAENIVDRFGITREEQDAYSYHSQVKAVRAIDEGRFKDQIVPVEIKDRRGNVTVFDTDEYPKRDTSPEKLAKLKPAFKKDGSVTAGNASGLNDGASAMVVMSESEAARRGLKPMARLKAFAFAGVEPSIMGVGPVPAVRKALEKAGLSLSDIGLIESNEAFAAQCLYVSKELGMDDTKVNVNGGAIALGHPVGATGNMLVVKLMYEMQRQDVQYGLATLCIGGGMGCAVIIEKV